jgi:hypothetical protein
MGTESRIKAVSLKAFSYYYYYYALGLHCLLVSIRPIGSLPCVTGVPCVAVPGCRLSSVTARYTLTGSPIPRSLLPWHLSMRFSERKYSRSRFIYYTNKLRPAVNFRLHKELGERYFHFPSKENAALSAATVFRLSSVTLRYTLTGSPIPRPFAVASVCPLP